MKRAASWREEYTPKLITALREGYGWADLRADALAGLSVAIVALPLAMAIAVASGAPPEAGLVTAAVTGIVISALGGSRHQIGGPTAAFIVVVSDVIVRHGYDGMLLATLMAGVMLLAAGWMRLGLWMKYVPQPVVLGFTVGIAAVIFSTQIGDMLGFPPPEAVGEGGVIERWRYYFESIRQIDPVAAAVGIASLCAILLLRARGPRLPSFLIVGGAAALLVAFSPADAPTIGSRFGGVPLGLPELQFPVISLERIGVLLPSAFTIAFLAGIESLLTATLADGMTGRRHRSNCELVAQGVANIASVTVGGLPATGTMARTATNIRAGARTPVAGILHGVFLLLVLLIAAPLADYAPMAALAAIVVAVAFSMAEPRRVGRLLRRGPRGDRFVFLVTFGLTTFVSLTLAVQIGVVLAAIMFMHRMAEAVEVTGGPILPGEGEAEAEGDAPPDWRARLPEGARAFTVRGPLFYGAANRVRDVLSRESRNTQVFVLDLNRTPVVDMTGADTVKELADGLRRRGAVVIVSGARPRVRRTLEAARLLSGEDLRYAASGWVAARMAREIIAAREDAAQAKAEAEAEAAAGEQD